MAAVELAIRTAMHHLGANLLGALLGADRGYRGPEIDCGAGHRARFVGYRDKTFDTVLGPVRATRAYYHCAACRHGVVPKDDQLGVPGASLSPGLRAMVARLGANLPFAKADELLAELTGIELTTKRVERAAEADGTRLAAAIVAEIGAINAAQLNPLPPPDPLPKLLYIAVDGTGVPTTPTETDGRQGKGADGRARTREVKLACLFTQSKLDDDGRPIRDPGPASYVATFEPAAAFGKLVKAEARRRGLDHIRQPVVLGDGAAWIWNLAAEHFPEATQIVDLYHAREHVHALANTLAFIVADPAGWLAERLTDLDNGDIPALLAAAREYPLAGTKADDRDKALHYFEANAHRMDYAGYRELGMFVGSGMVEAGCKTVIGARLKQSGMRWSLPGADAIIALRCQQASGRWSQIWTRPHYQTAVA